MTMPEGAKEIIMMKRKWTALGTLVVATIFVCLLTLAGCAEAPVVPVGLTPELNGTKLTYNVGETFNGSAITAKVRMSDGTDVAVANSDLAITGPDMAVSGLQLVKVSYNGLGATFQVSVMSTTNGPVKNIVILNEAKYAVTVVTDPTGTNYSYPSDMQLLVTYENDKTQTVVADSNAFSGTVDLSKAGSYPITVNYGGQTASYTVTVEPGPEVTVSVVSIYENPDMMAYGISNSKLDLSGLSVLAVMADGSKQVVVWTPEGDHNGISTTPENGSTIDKDNSKVTVAYGGQSTELAVNYAETRALSSIELVSPPNRTQYSEDHKLFDATGLRIRAIYDDGSSNILVWSVGNENYTLSRAQNSEISERANVVVTYKEGNNSATTTFPITFNGATIATSITILDKPQYSLTYVTDAAAEGYTYPKDMKIRVVYNDTTTKEVTVPTSSFSGLVKKGVAGVYPITVTYEGQTDTYNVTVADMTEFNGSPLTSIRILDKTKYERTYVVGDYKLPQDMELLLTYANGSTQIITAGPTMFGLDTDVINDQAGTYLMDVTYGGKLVWYTIEMVDKTTGIAMSVSNESNIQKEYTIGSSFIGLTGLALDIRYGDGTIQTLTWNEVQELLQTKKITWIATGPKAIDLPAQNEEGKYGEFTEDHAGLWTVTVKYTPEPKNPIGVTARALSTSEPKELTCTYDFTVIKEATLPIPVPSVDLSSSVVYSTAMVSVADTDWNKVTDTQDVAYAVTLKGNGPKNATYTYRYGIDYLSAVEKTVVVQDGAQFVTVHVPVSDKAQKLWLTSVSGAGYQPYSGSNIYVDLPAYEPKSVVINLIKTNPYDWAYTLQAGEGASGSVQYRYGRDGEWQAYGTGQLAIFPADYEPNSIILQARVVSSDGSGTPVSSTWEVLCGRYAEPTITTEYMVQGDPTSYPVFVATSETGSIMDVNLNGGSDTAVYTSDSNVAKMVVTENVKTGLEVLVRDDDNKKMFAKAASSNQLSWSRVKNYAVGDTGPAGGKITNIYNSKYYEIYATPGLQTYNRAVYCNGGSTGSWATMDKAVTANIVHTKNCLDGIHCQVWELTHGVADEYLNYSLLGYQGLSVETLKALSDSESRFYLQTLSLSDSVFNFMIVQNGSCSPYSWEDDTITWLVSPTMNRQSWYRIF